MPTAVLLPPVVLELRALAPNAELPLPDVLEDRAPEPTAVLTSPLVLAHSANEPTPVLVAPDVLENRASAPTAVLSEPDVLEARACSPSAVSRFPVDTPGLPAPVPRLRSSKPWAWTAEAQRESAASRTSGRLPCRIMDIRDMVDLLGRCRPAAKLPLRRRVEISISICQKFDTRNRELCRVIPSPLCSNGGDHPSRTDTAATTALES